MKNFYQECDFFQFAILEAPDSKVDFFNLLNMLLLFSTLFFVDSRFMLAPGVSIALPVVQQFSMAETMGTVTIQSEKLIIFDGEIFSLTNLEQGIKKYLVKHGCANAMDRAILVRGDKSLGMGTLLKVCEIIRRVGFGSIQIAASQIAQ